MKFTKLECDGIKGVDPQAVELDQVTLFVGPNGSGKSALMEASRLAATGKAAIGDGPTKQKLLVSDKAEVVMTGEDLSGHWKLDGKRQHILKCQGMDVRNVCSLPVTADDFWELTGGQKWMILETIVGAFTSEEPGDPGPIKMQLQRLQSLTPPDEYTGKPLAVLQSESTNLRQWLVDQRESNAQNEYRKERNSQARKRLESLADLHTKQLMQLDRSKDELDERQKDGAEAKVLASAALMTNTFPELTKYGGTYIAAITGVVKAFRAEAKEAHALDSSDLTNDMLDKCEVWLERIGNGEPHYDQQMLVKDAEKYQELEELLSEKFNIMLTPHVPESEIVTQVETEIAHLESIHNSNKIKAEATDKEIAALRQQIEDEDQDLSEAASTEALTNAASNLHRLERQLQRAEEWDRWSNGAAERQRQIKKYEEQIAEIEEQNKEYNSKKKEYLTKASTSVEDEANKILSLMNLPPMSLDIKLKGKRSTLSISRNGVNIEAMSGAERAVYGSVFLHVLQQASTDKVPLLWIEAAELDSYKLMGLCFALTKQEKRGNVFIAHHVHCIAMDRLSLVDLTRS